MFTQVDELTNDRHQKACFMEYQEALVRVIDKASLPPLNLPEDQQMTKEEKESQTLFEKIENTIPYLLSCCQQKWYEKSYVAPQKNIEENLYILINGQFF